MIKTVVKVAEIGIGLTIALFIGGEIFHLLDLGLFDYFNPVLSNFVYLFGYNNIVIFASILCGLLIVYAGRWIYSWASNNGGSSPNSR